MVSLQNFGFFGFFGHLTMFWTSFGALPYRLIGFFGHLTMFSLGSVAGFLGFLDGF